MREQRENGSTRFCGRVTRRKSLFVPMRAFVFAQHATSHARSNKPTCDTPTGAAHVQCNQLDQPIYKIRGTVCCACPVYQRRGCETVVFNNPVVKVAWRWRSRRQAAAVNGKRAAVIDD